jgi:hypothetical protein
MMCSMVSGGVVFGEFEQMSGWEGATFSLGALVVFGGVALLASQDGAQGEGACAAAPEKPSSAGQPTHESSIASSIFAALETLGARPLPPSGEPSSGGDGVEGVVVHLAADDPAVAASVDTASAANDAASTAEAFTAGLAPPAGELPEPSNKVKIGHDGRVEPASAAGLQRGLVPRPVDES